MRLRYNAFWWTIVTINSLYILFERTVSITKKLTLDIEIEKLSNEEKKLTSLSDDQLTKEDFAIIANEDKEAGYLMMRNISAKLAILLAKTDEHVVKLATALSLAVSGH